jgi:hypothetical protein
MNRLVQSWVHPLLVALCISGLAHSLPAQAASYTYISQKPAYVHTWSPELKALNLPKIGQTFQIQVPEGTVGRVAFLAFGASNPNVLLPALGGYLFTSAEAVVVTPFNTRMPWRNTTMSFAIPNSTQLLGVRFHQQVLQMSSCGWTHCPVSFNLSRGGVGVIGR